VDDQAAEQIITHGPKPLPVAEAAMTMTRTVPQVPSISALAADSKCLA